MGLRTFFFNFLFNDNKNSDSGCDAEKNLNVTVIRPRIANIPKMLGYFCEMHGMIQYIFHNTSFNSHLIPILLLSMHVSMQIFPVILRTIQC